LRNVNIKNKAMKKYFLSFASAVLGATIALVAYNKISSPSVYSNDVLNPMPVKSASLTSSAGLPDFTAAAERSLHAVVHVKTKMANTYYSTNPMFDFFFGNGAQQYHQPQIMPVGSGVCITSDGYIVTNNHVISNSDYVEVVLDDKRTYTAKIVGTDPTTDIALLKIDADNLPYIPYGNSDDIKIGEWVLAVGNPFNLTSTVTAGIVSAKARNINILSPSSIESFIQTDAAVNPGNSGGALVNTNGDLVGINTAIASQTGNYIGYSFAVPVNIVKKVVADIIEFGEVQRAYLGINISSVNQQLAASKGIDETQGVYVEDVYPNGACADAGIQKGDVISGLNEFKIKDIPQLHEQLSKYRPGDKINITIFRKGEKVEKSIQLKNRKNNTEIVKTEEVVVLGSKFKELTGDDKNNLRLNYGVKVGEVGDGKLKNAGIRSGFIITNINRQPVATIDDVETILNQIKGTVLVEGVYPNGMYAYFTFVL
jgi:Do/DeqQ family serine protease